MSETSPTPPRPIALSPSRASDYRQCPLKYRLRAIDRIEEPKTIHQVKGTLVHAVLETMFDWPREERTYPAAVKQLRPAWEAMREAEPACAEPVQDELQLLIDARALLKGYFQMENPLGFDPHAQEMRVDTVLPNGVPVRGFIDRVDVAPTGEVRIVDYKTGKMPRPRFSQDALAQMKFYGLVYWRLFGVVPTQLKLMYLGPMRSLAVDPTLEELEYVEHDLDCLWSKITEDGLRGEFQPRVSRLCDWCSFQSMCPAFGGTPPPYPGWPGGSASSV